ncbi:MAG TPA: hypothetical protein VGQ20_13600 [Acidimicrobiales bacterium]|jgi:hypothetical protein|nr:hypothetical protein [Acidimicrobiales bacterium]
MPASLKELSVAAQDQLLSAVKTSQAVMLDGVRAWSDAVEAITPSSLSPSSVPGLDALPSPAEILDLSFDFTTKLLTTQKEFADSLLGAITPMKVKAPVKK